MLDYGLTGADSGYVAGWSGRNLGGSIMYEGLRRYTLTAKPVGGRARRATVWADNDSDAMFVAIDTIMGKAYRDPEGPWARGRIELADPDGVVLHVMPAKDGV